MAKSTKSAALSQDTRKPKKLVKPEKPYKDFPLFPHATRRWAKKIRGKLHYFGPWADWQGALTKYQEQRDDLHAGRTPRVQGDGLTLRDLVNRFLASKRHLLDTREITVRTWSEYYAVCARLIEAFGKSRLVEDLAADDFETLRASFAERFGPVTLTNEIQRVRTVFKWGYDANLIKAPMRFGPGFKRPSKKTLRLERAKRGIRMFESSDILRMIDAAGPQLKAMILLGINCGFGNTDVATLPLSALDLKAGWVNFPRPKTGIPRRCPLWPETVQAVKAALEKRPNPNDDPMAETVFITKYGGPWAKTAAREDEDGKVKLLVDGALVKEMTKLMNALEIRREGLGFYALRHTLQTIGDEVRDPVAVDHIMGHAREDIANAYRERIGDDRLQAVVEHVRKWLFPPKAANE